MGFILPEQSAKACRDSASLQEQKNPNKTEIVSVETTPSHFSKARKSHRLTPFIPWRYLSLCCQLERLQPTKGLLFHLDQTSMQTRMLIGVPRRVTDVCGRLRLPQAFA